MTESSVKIIGAMASFKDRKATLFQSVNSIINQVDHLYLYLNDYDEIPPLNSDRTRLTIILGKYAMGDIKDTAKFAVISTLTSVDSYILTLDDDIVYPEDYVSTMINKLGEYNTKTVVGVYGVKISKNFNNYVDDKTIYHFDSELKTPISADILGTGTMIFRIQNISIQPSDFKIHGLSDVWFAKYCHDNSIGMVCIDREENWLRQIDKVDNVLQSTHTAPYSDLITKIIKKYFVDIDHDYDVTPQSKTIGKCDDDTICRNSTKIMRKNRLKLTTKPQNITDEKIPIFANKRKSAKSSQSVHSRCTDNIKSLNTKLSKQTLPYIFKLFSFDSRKISEEDKIILDMVDITT